VSQPDHDDRRQNDVPHGTADRDRSPSAAQQPTPASPRPNTDYAEPDPQAPPVVPATSFVMPDVPDNWNHFTSYDGRRFSVRFSVVAILDYSAFSQGQRTPSV